MKIIHSLDQLKNNSPFFSETDHGLGYWAFEIKNKSLISWPECVHNGTCGKICLVLSFENAKMVYLIRKHIDCNEKRFSICYRDTNEVEDDFDYECGDCAEL